MPTIDTPTAEGATNVLLNQRSLDPPYYRQAVGIQGDENAGKAIGFDDDGVLGAIEVGGDGGEINVKSFGATGDGITNDAPAIQAAVAQFVTDGGTLVIPCGNYYLGTEIVIGRNITRNSTILASGAVFTTGPGVTSGLSINAGSAAKSLRVVGLMIDHQSSSADAIYGFNLYGCHNVTLEHCAVMMGTNAAYAAFRIGMETASNPGSGCFWCRLLTCACSIYTGPNRFAGVVIEGDSNANVVRGCKFDNCETSVLIRNQVGTSSMPNHILCDNNSCEGFTTGFHVTSTDPGSNFCGYLFTNNRFEGGAPGIAAAFSFTGITTQPSTAPNIAGSVIMSEVANYLNNPNNLGINCWDQSTTPAIRREVMGGLRVSPLGDVDGVLAGENISPNGWTAIRQGNSSTRPFLSSTDEEDPNHANNYGWAFFYSADGNFRFRRINAGAWNDVLTVDRGTGMAVFKEPVIFGPTSAAGVMLSANALSLFSPLADDHLVIKPKGGGLLLINYGAGGTAMFCGGGSSSLVTIDSTGNVECTQVGKGFILKSPDGHRWRINVSDAGALSTTDLGT